MASVLQNLNPGKIPARYLAVLAAVIALLIPWVVTSPYLLHLLVIAEIYMVLALGLNIVVGFAGLLDLGYVAFYGIGAYTAALLSTHFHLSFWLILPVAALLAAVFGILLGAPTLRLRGDYLAIVTLGFGEIVRIVMNNWDSLTNGPRGISGIPSPSVAGFSLNQNLYFYYLLFVLILAVIFVVLRLQDSRIGRAWTALREDEVAANAMGINTTRMKLLAFATGASFAGMVGAFFAVVQGFVSPESFTFFESVIILCMVVLGGMGSIPGVVLGALILVFLPELPRMIGSLANLESQGLFSSIEQFRYMLFGVLMVAIILWRPQGLIASRRKLEILPDDGKTKFQEEESEDDVERKKMKV